MADMEKPKTAKKLKVTKNTYLPLTLIKRNNMDKLIMVLRESQKTKELLSLFDSKEDITDYYIGYISYIFDDSILIHALDENNEPDGYILIRFVDLFKIEKSTKYLSEISLTKKNIVINPFGINELDVTNRKGIDYLLTKFINSDEIVTIKLIYDDYIVGKIIEYDEEYVIMYNLTKHGKQDGISIFKYEDIQGIACGRAEEKCIDRLLTQP